MSLKGASVEGIWQGLKTFEGEGISRDTILNTTMRNIKRTVRTHGKPKGHLVNGNLLGYLEARKELYVPTYNWVLENKCMDLVKEFASHENVILLDYNTNEDLRISRSH